MKAIPFFSTVALCLLLAACGFTPLYGTDGAAQQQSVRAALDSIHIEVIPDRKGQMLRNMLMDRLYMTGRPSEPAYTLAFTPVAERRTDLDITKSADATRGQLRLRTRMTLTANDSGEIALERNLSAITSYNILQSRFTTRVSEQDARENALKDLARQAEQQLALYFNRSGR